MFLDCGKFFFYFFLNFLKNNDFFLKKVGKKFILNQWNLSYLNMWLMVFILTCYCYRIINMCQITFIEILCFNNN